MKKEFSNGMVLFTIILIELLTGMEFDLFVPSFPDLQDQFNLSPFWVEALLSINFVGYCLSLFFVGALADRYGRKSIIVLGQVIFIMGTLLCLFSDAYLFLLMGRFLQGLGIAAPAIIGFLIIADSYPLNKQQYFMAMLNGVMNIGVAASPIIGSYITLYFDWQGNFKLLFALAVITFIMTFLFIPHYQLPMQKETLSLRNYLPLFQSKSLMLLIAHLVFMITPYWIFVGMSPLLYMEAFGVSLAHFGYYQGALALVFALGSIVFGKMIHRYDQNKLLAVSIYILTAGLLSIALVTVMDSHDPLLITLAFLPFIIGQIIPSTLLYPLCLNVMPQSKGHVSAIIQGSRLLLSALGLQLASHYYVGSFKNIGFIILGFIFVAIITLFYVVKNQETFDFHGKNK